MHVRLPGVQSVDLQFALVNEWYEDEKIHSLALHSCLYHLVQIARFRAKDYISRGVVLV